MRFGSSRHSIVDPMRCWEVVFCQVASKFGSCEKVTLSPCRSVSTSLKSVSGSLEMSGHRQGVGAMEEK